MVVHYCATFLKPEMLHVYRQITGIREFKSVVFTQRRENAERFPFEPVIELPKPATHQLRRFWQKTLRRQPIQIYPSEARRIATAAQAANAALMHIYFGHIGVLLLPLIERAPFPVIVSFHGADGMVDLDKPAHRQATERMLDRATLVLARSESLAQRLSALGCLREKIRIHRTGIPLAELPLIERRFPSDGAWRFLQACRLIEKKGLKTTLLAFAEFREKHPLALLTIAGEGPMLAELQSMAQGLGLTEAVTFCGFVSQADLRALFREAHAFIHPSELGADGNQEGVPNSMLEAMATGLPVLATTHGGIPEAVENGISGVLVAERDHSALARAMLLLAADPVHWRAMGGNAAQAVSENFEQSAQICVLESCYREAIRLSRGGLAERRA